MAKKPAPKRKGYKLRSYVLYYPHPKEMKFGEMYAKDLQNLRKNLMAKRVRNVQVYKKMEDGGDEPFLGRLAYNRSLKKYIWTTPKGVRKPVMSTGAFGRS